MECRAFCRSYYSPANLAIALIRFFQSETRLAGSKGSASGPQPKTQRKIGRYWLSSKQIMVPSFVFWMLGFLPNTR